MLQESLGLIETIGLTAAVAAADAAVKSANVTLVGYELANGDGMTVIKVRGDVGAVQAAISAAAAEAARVGTVVSTSVIARPANGLGKIVESGATVGLEKPAAAVAAVEVSPEAPWPVEDVVADDPPLGPETPVTEAAEAPVEEVASAEPEAPAVAEASVALEIEVAAEPAAQAASHAQPRADRRHRRR